MLHIHLHPINKRGAFSYMIPLFIFILSCLAVFSMYGKVIRVLEGSMMFEQLSDDRKLYVVKNVIKGVYLSVLVVLGSFIVIPAVVYDSWNNSAIAIFGSLYCSNDFVGLLRVPSLPMSTRMHHMACLTLLLVAWSVDFQTSAVGQLIVLYTYFSAWAFVVNLYLGLRLCFTNMEWLRHLAKWVYTLTCGVNWAIQVWQFTVEPATLAYACLILAVVYDDLVLIQWLWKMNRRPE